MHNWSWKDSLIRFLDPLVVEKSAVTRIIIILYAAALALTYEDEDYNSDLFPSDEDDASRVAVVV